IDEQARKIKLKNGVNLNRTENNLYLIPQGLGPLMGHPKARYAADLVNMVCGIQKYSGSGRSYKEIFNPRLDFLETQSGRVYLTKNALDGVSYAKPEYWNQIRVWDILNQYLNS